MSIVKLMERATAEIERLLAENNRLAADNAALLEALQYMLPEFIRIAEWADYDCQEDGAPADAERLPWVSRARAAINHERPTDESS